MRRIYLITAGLVVLGAAAGVGANAAMNTGKPSHVSTIAAVDPQKVADSLASASARRHYGLPQGTLVSATVCVRTRCVTKQYAPAPTCAPDAATCLGTALVARKYPHNLTITVELA
jgi:hypothetical protein